MKRYHEVNIKAYLDVGDKNLVQFEQGNKLVGGSTSTEVNPLRLPVIGRPRVNLPKLLLNAYVPDFDKESSNLFYKEPLVNISTGNSTEVDPLLLPVTIQKRNVRTNSFLPQEETACVYIEPRTCEEVDPLLLPIKSANQIKPKIIIKRETNKDFVMKLEPLSDDDDPVSGNNKDLVKPVQDEHRDEVINNRIRSSSCSSSSSISSSSSSYSSSSSSTYKSASDSGQKSVANKPSILNSLRSLEVHSSGCVDKLKLQPVVSLQRLEHLDVKKMRTMRTRTNRQRKLGAGRGNVVPRSTVVTEKHRASKLKRSSSEEKPYPCPWDICSWKFRSWPDLQRHYLTHSQKPYKCHQCQTTFKRADLLVRHRKNAHWLETVQASPVSVNRTAFKR